MIKRVLIFGLLFASFIVLATEEPKEFTKDSKLYYYGPLTKVGIEQFKQRYLEDSESIVSLVIRSPGGEINLGMSMGEFIFDNRISIEVNEYCFSSCANYIFTAAYQKTLNKHALIGFHGGASSSSFDQANIDKALELVPVDQREKIKQEMLAKFEVYLSDAIQREKAFFEKIGVNPKITTIGENEEYKKYSDMGEYVGWYYSLASLEKLGVSEVKVLNPPWTPTAPKGKGKVFKIEIEID